MFFDDFFRQNYTFKETCKIKQRFLQTLPMDIDILQIDKKIREKWQKKQDEIVEIDEKIDEFQQILDEDEKFVLSIHVRTDLQEKITELKNEKDHIQNLLGIADFYTMEVNELLRQKSEAHPQKISFMKREKKSSGTHDLTKKYLEILRKYDLTGEDMVLSVADMEIGMASSKSGRERAVCSNCDSVEFAYMPDGNLLICEACGKQEEKVFKTVSFKDISRVNMSNKYTYERRIHFKDCMNQYQGKQNATVDEKVYRDLEEQFFRHDLLNGDLNTPKKQRFERITKEHIMMFLKETGHTKHYEDIVLIYHTMTGKKVDDISHLEGQLMDDFDKISELYDKKYKMEKKIDRKSFINTQYILFQLLRRHKYPCKREDFNMLKTLDRQSFHDDIVRDLFEQLGFNFTPIF